MSAQTTDRKWLIATAISVFALCASAASAFYASRQSQTASDTAKRQLRPYINIAPSVGDQDRSRLNIFEVGKKIRAEVALENSGQTPAYEVRVVIDTKIAPLPLLNNFDFIGRVITERGLVGPHTKFYPTIESEIEITDSGHKDVENSKSVVYVYGRVEYTDSFGKNHWTEFCLWYGLFNPTVASLCNLHNDGDRE